MTQTKDQSLKQQMWRLNNKECGNIKVSAHILEQQLLAWDTHLLKMFNNSGRGGINEWPWKNHHHCCFFFFIRINLHGVAWDFCLTWSVCIHSFSTVKRQTWSSDTETKLCLLYALWPCDYGVTRSPGQFGQSWFVQVELTKPDSFKEDSLDIEHNNVLQSKLL